MSKNRPFSTVSVCRMRVCAKMICYTDNPKKKNTGLKFSVEKTIIDSDRAKLSKQLRMKPILVKTGYLLAAIWSILLSVGGICFLVILLSSFCDSREMDENATKIFITVIGALLGVPPFYWSRIAIVKWVKDKWKEIDESMETRLEQA